MARTRACLSLIFMWIRSGSISWSPIDSTGLSDVIGSWKIIETSRPRNSRISSSDNASRSRPQNLIAVALIFVFPLGSSRTMASAETDLPDPDSPTIATISPGLTA